MKQLYKFIGSHLAFARHHFLEGYRSTKQDLRTKKYEEPTVTPHVGAEF